MACMKAGELIAIGAALAISGVVTCSSSVMIRIRTSYTPWRSKQKPAYLFLPVTPEALSPSFLLYCAVSEGEHSISMMSKPGGCNLKDNLSSAIQGFVYIFGSVI